MEEVVRALVASGLVAAALLTSASTVDAGRKDKKAKKIVFSGFMENYDQLQRADEFSEFVWGYTKRPMILREYEKVLLDPILVYFHKDAKGVAFDPVRLAELAEYFREALIKEMAQVRQLELVEQPGPGVMRIRIAVTDIDVTRNEANIGTKVAGAATAGVGFLLPSVDVGGATMECEVLDSETGERLVAVVDTETGRRMLNFNSMKSMGDAKAALREWARDFRNNLQRIHEGKLPKGIEKARKKQ